MALWYHRPFFNKLTCFVDCVTSVQPRLIFFSDRDLPLSIHRKREGSKDKKDLEAENLVEK